MERLKQLRKLQKMTQKEFGEKIGVSGDTISSIETGKVNLTDRNISLICEKFNVNEEWLREGKGEIFCRDEKTIVNELVDKYNLDDLLKTCVEVLITLDTKDLKPLLDYAKKVAVKYTFEHMEEAQQVYEEQKEQEVQQEQEEQQVQEVESQIDEDIERELEAYRLELLAEKKGKTSSVCEDYAKRNA